MNDRRKLKYYQQRDLEGKFGIEFLFSHKSVALHKKIKRLVKKKKNEKTT